MDEITKDPKERRVSVTFTTTQEMKDWIFNAAEQDERSVSVFLTRMIRDSSKQPVQTSEQS